MQADKKLYKQLFIKITVCSLISLVIYLALQPVLGAIMNEAENHQVALWFLSFAVAVMFSLLLIYRIQGINKFSKSSVYEAHGEHYLGMWEDLKIIIKSQLPVYISIFSINILCWGLTALDNLIFGKRTFTVILILFAPLNIIVEAIPDWLPKIFGYIIGAIFVCSTYILELVLLRKKWFKNSEKDEQGVR